MYKGLFLIIAILFSFNVFSQTKNSDLSGIIILKECVQDSTDFQFKDTSPAPTCDVEYLRYCMHKYKEQRKDGYFFLGAGCLCGLVALNTKDDSQQIFGSIALAGAAWGGYRVVSADKWLAQASVKPTRDGIGFVVEF